MDWWFVIKVIWGAVGGGLVGLILILAWRARSVIAWNQDIRKQLHALTEAAEQAAPARKEAIHLVIDAGNAIFRSLSPAQDVNFEYLHRFIRSIAACFFPDAERPERQVPLGHLIRSIEASLFRFDRILRQPGLKRIQALNIRTLRGWYRWSQGLLAHPMAKWYLHYRSGIQRLALARLFIVADPLVWLFFLSRKLLVLLLMRLLLVDIVLFVGRLAIDSFDGQGGGPVVENTDNLEATLNELAKVRFDSGPETDSAIIAIRRRLVGFPTIMLFNPTWQDWRTAIRKAAEILARRHFPDADNPLEEAAVGPLLHRTRSYLNTLARGDRIIGVRAIYHMRLETLIQARDITELVFSPMVRGIVRTTAAAYGWVKWPLKIYRRLKRFSLPGVAMDLGWVVGKKSVVALICGRTFDHACREIDWVYRASAAMKTSGAAGHSAAHSTGPDGRRPPRVDH